MAFCKLYAQGGSCPCLDGLDLFETVNFIGPGTGQRSATVAQTSIRGLATARMCVSSQACLGLSAGVGVDRPHGAHGGHHDQLPGSRPNRDERRSTLGGHVGPYFLADGPDEAGKLSCDRCDDNRWLLASGDHRAITST